MGAGIFACDNIATAKDFGAISKKLYTLKIGINNNKIAIVDAQNQNHGYIPVTENNIAPQSFYLAVKEFLEENSDSKFVNTDYLAIVGKNEGYDAVIIKNVIEGMDKHQTMTDFIIYKSSSIISCREEILG